MPVLIKAEVKRCKELMEAKHLNANALAVRSGITPSTLYSFLKGDRKYVSTNVIYSICVGLEISISDFFDSPLFDDLEPEK